MSIPKMTSPKASIDLARASRALPRRGLHHEVRSIRRFGAEFVGTVFDHQVMSAKVVKRGRRRGGPLERSGLPRINGSDRAAEAAPDEVEEEDELSSASEQGGDGDEFVHRDERRQIVVHKG